MNQVVFDIECYPNVFTFSAKEHRTSNRFRFEISWRRNDIDDLMRFLMMLKVEGVRMVGFNNQGYDYPVLHFIIENYQRLTVLDIYRKSMSIINTDFSNRFAHVVWDRDQHIPQLDLMKIHHFDNAAKATSLKVLEFNMRSANIKDLPFVPGTFLTSAQIDELIVYNDHDVDETEKFLDHSEDLIRFREELTLKYGRNFLNHNDTKIGKDYFIMELERLVPGFDRKRQTPRDSIPVAEILLPYIRFSHPEFKRVHEWFRSHVIYNTKGDLNLSCNINGFEFVFGTGGIHGSVDPGSFFSDDDFIIESRDVKSYYPNLAITNRLYPAHLGEQFCDIYKDMYEQRKHYPKGAAENAMLKLALNGTYGDSNNQYSPFYDPQFTMAITLNGQLLLCMLAEQLMKIPELQMLMINTDGLEYRVRRCYMDHIEKVCSWWQNITGLELESDVYSKLFIRDCNNYVGVFAE